MSDFFGEYSEDEEKPKESFFGEYAAPPTRTGPSQEETDARILQLQNAMAGMGELGMMVEPYQLAGHENAPGEAEARTRTLIAGLTPLAAQLIPGGGVVRPLARVAAGAALGYGTDRALGGSQSEAAGQAIVGGGAIGLGELARAIGSRIQAVRDRLGRAAQAGQQLEEFANARAAIPGENAAREAKNAQLRLNYQGDVAAAKQEARAATATLQAERQAAADAGLRTRENADLIFAPSTERNPVLARDKAQKIFDEVLPDGRNLRDVLLERSSVDRVTEANQLVLGYRDAAGKQLEGVREAISRYPTSATSAKELKEYVRKGVLGDPRAGTAAEKVVPLMDDLIDQATDKSGQVVFANLGKMMKEATNNARFGSNRLPLPAAQTAGAWRAFRRVLVDYDRRAAARTIPALEQANIELNRRYGVLDDALDVTVDWVKKRRSQAAINSGSVLPSKRVEPVEPVAPRQVPQPALLPRARAEFPGGQQALAEARRTVAAERRPAEGQGLARTIDFGLRNAPKVGPLYRAAMALTGRRNWVKTVVPNASTLAAESDHANAIFERYGPLMEQVQNYGPFGVEALSNVLRRISPDYREFMESQEAEERFQSWKQQRERLKNETISLEEYRRER